MTDEDAKMVGEENMRHSHATHDLFNEIKEGRFPEWTFGIQVSLPIRVIELNQSSPHPKSFITF